MSQCVVALTGPIDSAADHALGNSVGAIGSVVGRVRAIGTTNAATGIRFGVSQPAYTRSLRGVCLAALAARA